MRAAVVNLKGELDVQSSMLSTFEISQSMETTVFIYLKHRGSDRSLRDGLRGTVKVAFKRIAALFALVAAAPAGAQDVYYPSRWVLPGSDVESFMRFAQSLGLTASMPWSVRAFSTRDLKALRIRTVDLWTPHQMTRATTEGRRLVRGLLAPVTVDAWYNTAYPYGMNDGAAWIGRGLSLQTSFGATLEIGPLELSLRPIAFWAENADFQMLRPSRDSLGPFVDPLMPTSVDRPQRFGTREYWQLDLGASGVRLDFAGISIGLTNQHQVWGPMTEFPLIMGRNAAGFLHVHAGTSQPLKLPFIFVHGRVIYASLEQSEFSPVRDGPSRRFGSGAVVAVQPTLIPGLEFGAARFFSLTWPHSGLNSRYFTHLFEGFLKPKGNAVFAPTPTDPTTSTDNQLASVFARWVFPASGVEVYGEYGREDHNASARDALLEPDHSAAIALGVRKAWKAGGALFAGRAEIVNHQPSSLARHRGQGSWYVHGYARQGHTHRGQLLASPVAVGSGAGTFASMERFGSSGVTRLCGKRFVVRDLWSRDRKPEVQYGLCAEHQTKLNAKSNLLLGADVVNHLNRNASRDGINLRLRASWTFDW